MDLSPFGQHKDTRRHDAAGRVVIVALVADQLERKVMASVSLEEKWKMRFVESQEEACAASPFNRTGDSMRSRLAG